MNARVRLQGQALEEYNALKKVVEREEAKGIKSSENATLLRSIGQKIEWLKQNFSPRSRRVRAISIRRVRFRGSFWRCSNIGRRAAA